MYNSKLKLGNLNLQNQRNSNKVTITLKNPSLMNYELELHQINKVTYRHIFIYRIIIYLLID